MAHRNRKALADLRAALQPGVFFETKSGAIGRIDRREAGADGVKLTCVYACKTRQAKWTSELSSVVSSLTRLATAADYAAAVTLAQAYAKPKPPKRPAAPALSLRDVLARVEALEAQVAELRQRPRNALQVVR